MRCKKECNVSTVWGDRGSAFQMLGPERVSNAEALQSNMWDSEKTGRAN